MRSFKVFCFIFLLAASVANVSCGLLPNNDAKEAIEYHDSVLTEIKAWLPVVKEFIPNTGARSFQIYSNRDTNYITKKCVRVIVLNLDSCSTVTRGVFSKHQVASYCATQLFLKLDSEVIASHQAISILFDSHDPDAVFGSKEFYFTMSELDSACSAFDAVAHYLNAVNTGDYERANAMIDSRYFGIVPQELNEEIKKKLNGKPFTLFNCFDYYEYVNKDSTEKFECFAVFTGVEYSDTMRTSFSFMIPVDFPIKKIINYRLPLY